MRRFAHLIEKLHGYAALTCLEGDGRSHTFAELLEETARWQSRFDTLKVNDGQVVGVRADYSLSSIAVLLALLSRGCVAAMIPRHARSEDYLADACASGFIDLAEDGSYEWRALPHPPDHPLLHRLRTAGEGGIIIFTSGSTGRPKAALHSVERFLYKFDRPGRRFRTLAFLLFDHVAGLDTVFYTLVNGGAVIVTRRRDPRSILQLIESHQVEVLPSSPSFLRLLCSAKVEPANGLSSLRVITYGSEPMDASTLARLNELFPEAQIIQKYGTTELGSPRTVSRANDSLWLKLKSEDVETQVIDGVLWIRSPSTMLGYLNIPAPTDEAGWHCTGDLVDVDGEWIRFRGRMSEIINVGGEKVAPCEVEQTILQLDFVRDALVCGAPHALLGHIVTARVALTEVAPAPKEAIRQIRSHCQQQLAPHKVPIKVDISPEGFANDRQKLKRTVALP